MASAAPVSSPGVRSYLRAVGVGVVLGLGSGILAFSLACMPFLFLGRLQGANGFDDPTVRSGLLSIAVPVGLAVAVVVGALAGRWYRRGGHLPTD